MTDADSIVLSAPLIGEDDIRLVIGAVARRRERRPRGHRSQFSAKLTDADVGRVGAAPGQASRGNTRFIE